MADPTLLACSATERRGQRCPPPTTRRARAGPTVGSCSVLARPADAVAWLAFGELDRVQLPSVRDTLEPAGAAVSEGEPGPGDQVLDRPRAQDLAGLGLGQDPGRDMHRDAADVVA